VCGSIPFDSRDWEKEREGEKKNNPTEGEKRKEKHPGTSGWVNDSL